MRKDAPVIIIKADLVHIQDVQRKVRNLFGDDSVVFHLSKVLPARVSTGGLPDAACLANALQSLPRPPAQCRRQAPLQTALQ